MPLEGRTSYISFVLHKLAPAFRPEDAYAAIWSSFGAIDAGSRRSSTGPHPGIAGPYQRGDPGAQRFRDASRIRLWLHGGASGRSDSRARSSGPPPSISPPPTSALLRFRLPLPSSPTSGVTRPLEARRGDPSPITTHLESASMARTQRSRGSAGHAPGPDTHTSSAPPSKTEIQIIVDTGGTVTLASPVDIIMATGCPHTEVPRSWPFASLSGTSQTNAPGHLQPDALGHDPPTVIAAPDGKVAGQPKGCAATPPSREPGQWPRLEDRDPDARQAGDLILLAPTD